ncbi:hypothetical protein EVAR_61298_1 [Eumeta japonica]|uniref:Uncharacterized protein n=1 Tax=Eumeta variegata TaxID=151549 RepID=A0A4C1XJF4_EUMVA|nr:hypothetical protein EVAR_61298_1 [Eumeta japonica]
MEPQSRSGAKSESNINSTSEKKKFTSMLMQLRPLTIKGQSPTRKCGATSVGAASNAMADQCLKATSSNVFEDIEFDRDDG